MYTPFTYSVRTWIGLKHFPPWSHQRFFTSNRKLTCKSGYRASGPLGLRARVLGLLAGAYGPKHIVPYCRAAGRCFIILDGLRPIIE